jgi:hypothetical protein
MLSYTINRVSSRHSQRKTAEGSLPITSNCMEGGARHFHAWNFSASIICPSWATGSAHNDSGYQGNEVVKQSLSEKSPSTWNKHYYWSIIDDLHICMEKECGDCRNSGHFFRLMKFEIPCYILSLVHLKSLVPKAMRKVHRWVALRHPTHRQLPQVGSLESMSPKYLKNNITKLIKNK